MIADFLMHAAKSGLSLRFYVVLLGFELSALMLLLWFPESPNALIAVCILAILGLLLATTLEVWDRIKRRG